MNEYETISDQRRSSPPAGQHVNGQTVGRSLEADSETAGPYHGRADDQDQARRLM